MKYIVKRTADLPTLGADWNAQEWADAEIAHINNFRPESSSHRPDVSLKLKYNETGICGLFNVKDKYVRSVNAEFQSGVCADSCVEFFFKPDVGNGYFNLECNCGGTILCYYVVDHTRTPDGFKERTALTPEDGSMIRIFHTMPNIVDPEIEDDTEWRLGFFFPFALVEKYSGTIGDPAGRQWTANFYKCGDKTSHPHWASWSPVKELNFHLPECFGSIIFE